MFSYQHLIDIGTIYLTFMQKNNNVSMFYMVKGECHKQKCSINSNTVGVKLITNTHKVQCELKTRFVPLIMKRFIIIFIIYRYRICTFENKPTKVCVFSNFTSLNKYARQNVNFLYFV